MKLEGLSILGRNRAKPAGKPTSAINPAIGAALEPGYFGATAADVARAAQLAAKAFAEYGR
jgi:alpha-ketoglutaric semialdehyde dehydrogenase